MSRYFVIIILVIGILQSCSLQDDIEIDEQPYERQLMVECYLVPGLPYALYLTESVPYFADPDIPKITGATVIISHGDTSVTLYEKNDGVYFSNDTVPFDFQSVFTLYVQDTSGRTVTAKTTIRPPVYVDSVKYVFNDKNKAATLVYFTDPPDTDNYYKILLLTSDDILFTDKVYDGTKLPATSDFRMEEGTKLGILLLNISKEHHDFLHTVRQTFTSNNRPLVEPVHIKSNIDGGIGIFSGFYYKEKKVVVTR